MLFVIFLQITNHNSGTKVWVAHEVNSPKHQSQMTIVQYSLSKTKPIEGFSRNAFNKLLQNFKNYSTKFSTD